MISCLCCRRQTTTGQVGSRDTFPIFLDVSFALCRARGTIDIDDNEDDSFAVKGIGRIDIGPCYLLFIITTLNACLVFILPG